MIFGDLTSPDIKRVAPRTTALLPIAATEQHGNHLPVITDTAVLTELARRTEAALPRKVVLLPTLWVGSSHHHMAFPGTMSIRSETYILVLVDLIESLLSSGFRRIVLLNGHGGNIIPATEALYRVTQRRQGRTEPWVAFTSYWTTANRDLSQQKFMETPKLTHACEYETSLMLGLRADWVKMSKAKGRRVERQSKFYDPLGYTPSRVTVSETFAQMTDIGAMGKPERATAEKGLQLFDLITPCLVEFLQEFSTWKFVRNNKAD